VDFELGVILTKGADVCKCSLDAEMLFGFVFLGGVVTDGTDLYSFESYSLQLSQILTLNIESLSYDVASQLLVSTKDSCLQQCLEQHDGILRLLLR
jgi:hypothetical protein